MKNKKSITAIMFLIAALASSVFYKEDIFDYLDRYLNENKKEHILYSYSIDKIPAYNGEKIIYIDDNKPGFTNEEISTNEFENYSDLDDLGRCGVAYANVSKNTMPTEKRESIGIVKPSGWQIIKYDFIDGKYLYNRCHLIGYQLTGENANEKNLITCTRSMNSVSMLEYENKVASYVKKTNNHVLYRVTPIFIENNLIASGVQMEAYSVEDDGKGISFNIFIYNVEDKIDIDYLTGNATLIGDNNEKDN